ncbi:hypothetical protein K2X30_07055 [bacterium]|jgi:hypothetical protein|nr:hypothetical protein [bacterium]
MSPKAKKAPAKSAKPAAKKAAPAAAKSSKAAPAPAELKAAAPAEGGPDAEELEEQEEAAAAQAAGGGGNSAALAAAASTTEMSASFKNFRHHPDMENFYRFIYENDLRHEALEILDEIITQKQARKAVKAARTAPH